MEFILLHLFFPNFNFKVAIGSLIGKSLPLHYCSLKDESKYRFSNFNAVSINFAQNRLLLKTIIQFTEKIIQFHLMCHAINKNAYQQHSISPKLPAAYTQSVKSVIGQAFCDICAMKFTLLHLFIHVSIS